MSYEQSSLVFCFLKWLSDKNQNKDQKIEIDDISKLKEDEILAKLKKMVRQLVKQNQTQENFELKSKIDFFENSLQKFEQEVRNHIKVKIF